MMDKKQAETVADALLAPALDEQAAVEQRRAETQRMMNTHRRRGTYGLVGFLLGALAGYFIAGSLVPAAFIGLIVGMLVGYVFVKAE
ncbi:MAG TPA: hypothetical protein VF268_13355 [Gammaproteobacteria bacterium]